MGLLRTSSGVGQEVPVLRYSRARNSARGAAGAGFGLFVFAPSGQVTLGAVVQCPPETSDPAKRAEGTLWPTAGSVSFSSCPLNHLHFCPRASVTHPGRPQAGLSSLVQFSNRKSDWVTRTPGRMRKVSRRTPLAELGLPPGERGASQRRLLPERVSPTLFLLPVWSSRSNRRGG